MENFSKSYVLNRGIHQIFYETYGDHDGIPIVFLHGGPGLGCSEKDKRFFDPSKHFVVFIDQRGAGNSKPLGELKDNTTALLIEDVVVILDHLELENIHVFGGSWGATLAILFTARHKSRVKSLILRGFFSATSECVKIFHEGGLAKSHASAWRRLISMLPSEGSNNVARYYYDQICQEKEGSFQLGYEWMRYGLSVVKKEISEAQIEQIMQDYTDARSKIKIELYYALNRFFIEDGAVYEAANSMEDMPVVIVHGTHDYICPLKDAKRLDSLLSQSRLIAVDGGHSSSDKNIEKALLDAVSQLS